nr:MULTISPECIES: hypothetical protein [unclassified Paraburkholderia]
MSAPVANVRPQPDQVLVDIVDDVLDGFAKDGLDSAHALPTARHCLIDTPGCGFEALSSPACNKLLGPYGTHAMENVPFKMAFPAEFHAQTAAEAAMTLHGQLAQRGRTAQDIEHITIRTHAADYEDDVARDVRIDALRAKTVCEEDAQFTRDYHDPAKRSIANALSVEFNDGTTLPEVVVEYPIGHQRRRAQGIPLPIETFRANLAHRFAPKQQQAILEVSLDAARLDAMPVHEYVDLYVI